MTIGTPAPRGEMVEECGARFEVFALPTDEATLLAILNDCFKEWEHIHIGPLIPGAIWEIRPPSQPSISLRNGYATVDFQDWHFHIHIGERRGESPEIAALRRTSRVELFRRLNWEGEPAWWRLRFLNGAGDQQIAFMLPSPFVTGDQPAEDEPHCGHLTLWDRLRQRCLSTGPGQIDLPDRRTRRD